ncbi:hypothetical protein [Streptomyces sp. NPDC058622]|uniref:hypothetical protein n=1 Tax=Streptomyces sp. NPDC058622 TaxID=3346562 RepID=UPI0036552AF5
MTRHRIAVAAAIPAVLRPLPLAVAGTAAAVPAATVPSCVARATAVPVLNARRAKSG